LLLIYLPIYGQISVKETPYGLKPEIRSQLSELKWMQMKDFDLDELIEEDKIFDTIPGIPFRFGKNLYVNLNQNNSGTIDTLHDGSRIWRLGIVSKGALSINLTFDKYLLPKGGRLFVYTPEGNNVLGAFSELNKKGCWLF